MRIDARTPPCLGLMIAVSLGVGASGCVNTSSFQTAEVVERGESTLGLGMSFADHGDYEFDDGRVGDSSALPLVSGWYRRGVSDRLELKGLVSLGAGLEGGAKYRLAGMTDEQGGHLAMGATGRLGGMRVRTTDEEDPMPSAEWASVFDAVVPVHLGYRFSSGRAAYLTPQYAFRSVLRRETTYTHVLGSNLGFQWNTILFDLMGGYDVQAEAPLFSVGVGKSL